MPNNNAVTTQLGSANDNPTIQNHFVGGDIQISLKVVLARTSTLGPLTVQLRTFTPNTSFFISCLCQDAKEITITAHQTSPSVFHDFTIIETQDGREKPGSKIGTSPTVGTEIIAKYSTVDKYS